MNALRILFLLALLVATPRPSGAQVVINEIMYHPSSERVAEEYLELINLGDTDVNLAGWQFDRGVAFTFPSGAVLAPRALLVVAADTNTFRTKYPGVAVPVLGNWAGTLNNSDETVRLLDAAGRESDEVRFADEGDWATRVRGPLLQNHRGWVWQAEHDGLGRSLERVNPRLTGRAGANWLASAALQGSPGLPNAATTTNTAPLILDVAHAPIIPRSTETVTVTARIIDETGGAGAPFVTLHHRSASSTAPPSFTAVRMFDDGDHGDGQPGDGLHGAQIPAAPDGTVIEFYVLATDGTGLTRTWPAPALDEFGSPGQFANALFQFDNAPLPAGLPAYRLIMTEIERAELASIPVNDPQSDAQMNGTFVAVDGAGRTARYNAGFRNRGAGSRTANPPNYRVNLPSDRRWRNVQSLNLNSQNPHSQLAGFALATGAGLTTEHHRRVQVLVNGIDRTGPAQFGSYIHQEVPGGDMAAHHFPDDPDGNFYRASDGSHRANLSYQGTNPVTYASLGYAKASNTSENDWSDLIQLVDVLNNTPEDRYLSAVAARLNIDQWLRYFAVFSLAGSEETSLGTGVGDDYALYRGLIDPRFQLVGHDWDTILGQGGGGNNPTRSIFRATALAPINRLLRHPDIAPRYYAELLRQLDSAFDPGTVATTLDRELGAWVPAPTIASMKSYATNRAAQARSQIPTRITDITTNPALAPVGGVPQTTGSTAGLSGRSHAARTRAVRVNGTPATWDPANATWTAGALPLFPGINRLVIQAVADDGTVFDQAIFEVWRDDGSIQTVAGAIATDATWTPGDGPYQITSSLTINAGATLLIQPGTTVFLSAGASLTVMTGGRLVAEGTATAPIRFTSLPGSDSRWGGLRLEGGPASPETRIAHAHIDGNHATAIHSTDGTLFLSHVTFGSTDRQYLSLDRSSFLVQDCTFPAATGLFENVHGSGGIKAGGRGIFLRNFFGRANSVAGNYNDVLDFTGGNRPGPILQFINNVMLGSGDDLLDLDSTDAWIEGNIFLHAHRNGSPDSASAISGGADNADTSEITVIGNLFFDCDHAATAKQGNFYTLLNNTIVRQTRTGGVDTDAAVVNLADDGSTEGAGFHLEGNVIADAEKLVRHASAALVTFTNNVLPLPWAGPGGGNVIAPVSFNRLPGTNETSGFTSWREAQVLWDWLKPRHESTAPGASAGTRGVSLTGTPAPRTTATSATFVIGPNRAGPGIPTGPSGFPAGSGFTHYRWRLDDGPWSPETPIATPISLSGLPSGPHQLAVSGRNDAGLYQDDPVLGPDARPSLSGTWIVGPAPAGSVLLSELLADNRAALALDDDFPDVIELHNPGGTTADLSGVGVSDDPARPFRYTFPAGSTLAPGEYRLIVLSPDTTGFSLAAAGGWLQLTAPGGTVLDSVGYGRQLPDLSIGRLDDGAWGLAQPTPGGPNRAQPTAAPRALRINEWLVLTPGAARFEIVNPEPWPAALGGLFLSDHPVNAPRRHRIAPLSFIPARGHLVFIADGRPDEGPDHVSFTLDPGVGQIALLDDSSILDSVLYGPQAPGVSQGRQPDGADRIASFQQPTLGAPNPAGHSLVTNITTVSSNLISLTGTNWRYRQDNVDPGAAWTTAGYDDSAWSVGPGILAVENCGCLPAPINTPLTLGATTYYFRSTVVLPPTLATGVTFNAQIIYDDGAVIHVNGQPAATLNMPPAVSHFTFASGTSSEGTVTPIILPASAFLPGTNIIAIEIHQATAGSSDIVLGFALSADRSTTNITGSLAPVLNEILASNRSFTNADGTITDWVEVLNPADTPADLGDLSLSDNPATPRRWVFPAGTTLPGGARMIVRFDPNLPASTQPAPDLNAGFGLSADGDRLLLFDRPARGGALLDGITFGLQAPDFSIARVPEGTGPWQISLPTPGTLNVPTATGPAHSLRINEWMADPSGGDDWFELFNPAPQPVALDGLHLTDDLNNRTQYRIPSLSFIGTGVSTAFAEFKADGDPSKGANHASFKLGAGGEAIGLFAADGLTRIDSVTFGPQARGTSEGRFIDGSTNIIRFPRTSTPGSANYLPFTDVVLNEAAPHGPGSQRIELLNNTDQPQDLSGWWLSDREEEPRKFRLPDATILAPGAFLVLDESSFNATPNRAPSFALDPAQGGSIHLSAALPDGTLTGYRTSVRHGAAAPNTTFGRQETSLDAEFVEMASPSLGTPNPGPRVGPVVITEIHYHPPDLGTNDNTGDEFIELLNVSAATVPLFDSVRPTNTWRLRNAVDYDFPPGTTLAAGAHMIVVGFDPATNATETAAFRSRLAVSAGTLLLGPWRGKLDNSAETVELNRPGEPTNGSIPRILIERIQYRDTAPWPAEADGRRASPGLSLQRRLADRFGNEATNWVAAVPSPGSASRAAAGSTPAITTQPAPLTVAAGAPASFTVAATGAAPLAYQWRQNGVDIPNATNAAFSIPTATAAEAGRYSVRVTNPFGAAASADARLTVNLPPSITRQPGGGVVALGSPFTLTTAARGTAPLAFQWLRDGTPIPGATNATLHFAALAPSDPGPYSTRVSNPFGTVTSQVATIEIATPPAITGQPAPATLTVLQGQAASFTAAASGSSPLRLQWRRDGLPLPGQTNATLAIPNAQPADSGAYSLIATNPVGSAVSLEARLIVRVRPTVTLAASSPTTTESGPPGRFTVSRTGSNDLALTVTYTTSGSATPGSDYSALPGQITLPPGSSSAEIIVTPIDDPTPEAIESIVLTVAPGADFTLGPVVSASVALVDNDNLAPVVALTSPAPGTHWPFSPTNITLTASASDPDGTIARVEFFAGTTRLGEAATPPFTATWSVPGGTNVLTAVAVDNLGLATTSAPVTISATSTEPPIVAITTPANGATVIVTNLAVSAVAGDPDGSITLVTLLLDGSPVASTNSGTPVASTPVTNVVAQPVRMTDSVWRYDASGVDQGTGWRAPGFNDSGWPTGRSILAAEDCNCLPAAIGTTLPLVTPAQARITTFYFRTTFTLTPDELSNAVFSASLVYDDGAVLYVNGTQAAAFNMPATFNASTLALAASSPEGAVTNFVLTPGLFQPGTNVIAVEVHQSSTTSSDVAMGLGLRLLRIEAPPFSRQLYSFNIPSLTAGLHALAAVATDNSGRRATSAVVTANAQARQSSLADRFADRGLIGGANHRIAAPLDNATVESDEQPPASALGARQNSLWIEWVAPFDGLAILTTDGTREGDGSPRDTALTVYRGGTLPTLWEILSDDDSGADKIPGTTFGSARIALGVEAGVAYQIRITDYGSSTAGAVAVLNLTCTPTTSQPLDGAAVEAPELTWRTGGNSPGLTQTAISTDGDAFQTGPVANGQVSWFETTVQGPGTLAFQWMIRGATNFSGITDRFVFSVDQADMHRLPGSNAVFTTVSAALPEGPHTLRWSYLATAGAATPRAAWLDQVRFTPAPRPPTITTQPASLIVNPGASASFTVAATGAPLSLQWRRDGTDLPGASTPTLALVSVTHADAGDYSVIAQNASGSVTSQVARLTVRTALNQPMPLPGGAFGFLLTASPGTVVVETSGNLTDWRPVLTNTSPFARTIAISNAPNAAPHQFYRTRQFP